MRALESSAAQAHVRCVQENRRNLMRFYSVLSSTVATLFLLLGCSKPGKVPLNGKNLNSSSKEATDAEFKLGNSGSSVEIELAQPFSQAPLNGFLYGLDLAGPNSEAKTPDHLIHPLKPGLWRYGANWFFHRGAEVQQKILASNTRVMFLLSDAWPHGAGGWESGGTAPYHPARATEYSNMVTDYANRIRDLALSHPSKTFFFDIWNEPDLCDANVCFFKGSQAQFFSVFKTTYNIVKPILNAAPNVKIGGPSNSKFNFEGHLRPFIDFVQANALTLDFLSWHELEPSAWNKVRQHVTTTRSYIAGKSAVQAATIQINEIIGPGDQYDMFNHVAMFSELESLGVDGAAKACWPEGANVNNWGGSSNCFNGTLDGLLTPNLTPRNIWHFYRMYGQLGNTRAVSRSNATTGSVYTFSSPRNVDGCVQTVTANWAQSSSVNVTFKSVGVTLNGKAQLKVEKVGDAGSVSVEDKEVQIDGSSFSYNAPCGHKEVCSISLCPNSAAGFIPAMHILF
jgi:hypothetical protein